MSSKDKLIASLVEMTKSSQFMKASDIPFLRSMPAVSEHLDDIRSEVLELLNNTLAYCDQSDIQISDPQELVDHFQPCQDVLDNLLEKADVCIDTALGRTKTVQVKVAQVQEEVKEPKYVKPQTKFGDKIDNSNRPFVPKITYKPHAQVPLKSLAHSQELAEHMDSLSAVSQKHPYEYEIKHLKYPPFMFKKRPEILFKPMQGFIFVDTVDALKDMCNILEQSKEIAIDLEHHDYRTFLGFTCLMQISTRSEDFIIDALVLRNHMHLLNESFTNPQIVKVFHGAEMDVQWLQKDFGVYVVNLWDTFHASNLLEMNGHSYAYLLEFYCHVKTDKKYQLADWRQRPLSDEMMTYAQTDTHYLLYIYDRMRNELIDKSNPETLNLVHVQHERSALTSLKRFEKEFYDSENGQGPNGWAMTLRKCREPLNEEAFAVYKALHSWRDHVARKEDESTRYVLPNHHLFTLARVMPMTSTDVIGCCVPTPALVNLYASDLAQLIEETALDVRRSASVRKQQEQERREANTLPPPQHIRFEEAAEKLKPPKKPVVKVLETKKLGKTIVKRSEESRLFGDLLEQTAVQEIPQEISEMLKLAPPMLVDVEREIDDVPMEEQQPEQAEPESVEVESLKRSDTDELPVIAKESKKKTKSKKIKLDTDGFEPFDYSNAKVETQKSTETNDFNPHRNNRDAGFKRPGKNNARRKSGNKSMGFKK
ncbi:ribonuclease H-like domain-containing protein [Gorgonomyces haynaldii]|nr:ribonuclease H-like domain-containing protein [Gorgonomyces haynaldii]